MDEKQRLLQEAEEFAIRGEYWVAKRLYSRLLEKNPSEKMRARIENDLSAIAILQGHHTSAQLHASRINDSRKTVSLFEQNYSRLVQNSRNKGQNKIAILSLLFNWPSTGGGTVHTKELADFLQKRGYQVQHFYAVNESFAVGNVSEELGYESIPLFFSESEWNEATIRQRFQSAVNIFDPDWAIVTDSWNTKPILAEAVRGYPYFIRIAAEECLCPLNNVRMLFGEKPRADQLPPVIQCQENQLQSPETCRKCVEKNAHLSGGLHQAERQLGGFSSDEYSSRLLQSFIESEGVLAVNPEIAEIIKPYAPSVHVVPSGFDPLRFPQSYQPTPSSEGRKIRLLFAGLRNELMKGFHILKAATDQLWKQRNDFELWITGESHEEDPEYFRCLGWQTQEQLTEVMVATDILVFPTVAQEALGRSAVEAMGCGRPVVASRLGGLQWVIDHEKTGLLFESGNVEELCTQLELLLEDASLRETLGQAGHKKFQEEFTWDVILNRSYQKLFGPAQKEELNILL